MPDTYFGYDHGEDEMIEREESALRRRRLFIKLWPFVFCLIVAAAAMLLKSCAAEAFPESEIPALISTIIRAESSGRANVVGDGGKARGLMQIQESTWRRYTSLSFDHAFDAELNRKIGEKHVRHIIERYGRRASRALVIYTYNTGRFSKDGKLPGWTKKHPNNIYREVFRAEA